MVATGIYRSLDEAALVRMRDDVLTQLSAARSGRFNAVSGGGKSFGKQLLTLDELKSELAEITLALQAKNPDVYGRPVKRLHADFSRNVF